jgi:outer membrane murein-binding lipoprotein Lpp
MITYQQAYVVVALLLASCGSDDPVMHRSEVHSLCADIVDGAFQQLQAQIAEAQSEAEAAKAEAETANSDVDDLRSEVSGLESQLIMCDCN